MKKTDLKNEINNTRAYFQINDDENNMKKLDDLLVENQDVEDWFREEGESFEKGIEDEIVLFGHHIKINFYKLAQNSRYIRTHFTQFNVVSKLSSELFLFLNEFNHQSSNQSSLSSNIQMKYETENENIVDTQMKISHIEIFIKANQGEKFHLDMNNYFQLTELSSYFETFKFQKILYSYQKKYLNNPNFLLSYYLRRLQNFDFGNNNDNCMNNNNIIHKYLLDSHFLETKIINCLATSFESFLINYIPNEILYRILEKALKCSNTKGIPMNELFVFINNKLLERKIFFNFLELDELNTKNQMKFTELLRTYLNDETFICQLQFPTKYLLSLVDSNSQSLTLVHELISLLSNEIEEYGKRVQSILDIKLNTFNNLLYSEEFINKQMCLNTNIDHAEFKNLFLKLKLLFQKSIEKLTHYSEIKPKYDELSKVQEQLEAIKKVICDYDEEAARKLSSKDLLKKIQEDYSESKKLHETLDCDENNSEDKLKELQERSAELDKLRSELEAIKKVICDNDEEAARKLSAEDLLKKIQEDHSESKKLHEKLDCSQDDSTSKLDDVLSKLQALSELRQQVHSIGEAVFMTSDKDNADSSPTQTTIDPSNYDSPEAILKQIKKDKDELKLLKTNLKDGESKIAEELENLTNLKFELSDTKDELSKAQEQLEAIKKVICDNDEEVAKELSAEDLLKKIQEDYSESKKLHETLDCDENNSEDKLKELQERSAELDKLRSELEAIKKVICDNDDEAAKELSAEDLLQKIKNSESQKWPHSKTSYHSKLHKSDEDPSELDRLRKKIIGLNKILIVLIMMNKSTKNHS